MCITEQNSVMTDAEARNLEGIDIYKLAAPFDRTSSHPQKISSSSNTPKSEKKENKLADWVDKHFPIDTWLPFFWLKKSEIKKIIQQVNPDVVWSTSDPWSGGYMVGKIAKKLGYTWIADFRDPWTLCDVRFSEKGAFAKPKEEKVERWIAEHADFMTFTSIKTEEKYTSYYPSLASKTETIYNSFDSDIVIKSQERIDESKSLEILFLGTFRWLSNAKIIIDTLALVKEREPELFESIKLSSFGNLEGEDLALAKEKKVDHVFLVRNKVPVEQVQDEIANSDILLLSTHPERNDIVPAKLLDYLPSFKPILSVVQNSEVGDIITRTGRGVQFEKSKISEAATLLINCLKAKANKEELPFQLNRNEKEIAAFSSYYTTDQFAKLLTKASGNE